MTDIVERLRRRSSWGITPEDIREAANEIERLQAREAELQAQCGYMESIKTVEIEAADEIEMLRVNLGGSLAALKMTTHEMERMQAEIEQLSEQLAEATTEVDRLRELWENSPMAAR